MSKTSYKLISAALLINIILKEINLIIYFLVALN